MNASEEEVGPVGQTRRQWIAASAALVAGSMTACGTSSDREPASDRGSSSPGEALPAALPKFDTERCTGRIASAAVKPDEERFAAWNGELRARAAGRESALVDLDAVDHNLKLVGDRLGSSIGLRLVAKSLPSVQLLEYMMVTACTNRVMAFSEGMVRDLLCRFGSDVDILLGRPAAVDAAARTFATLDALGGESNPAGAVRWLIDTAERMQEFAALAAQRGESINVSIEIDVGLRRGGARNGAELLDMLAIVDTSELLRFAGFMGYEGHVPFAAMGGLTPDAEFGAVQSRYEDFVRTGREAYPGLFEGPLVYNSGGSRTYHYYTDDVDTPINEVAMGSAFFYPSNFHDIPQTALRTATFFATPVLKRIDPAETPFDQDFLPNLADGSPDLEVSYFMVAGGFPGEQTFPDGLTSNWNTSSTDDEERTRILNMLPNQGRWLGARQVPLEVGDFIFYQPWEGDAVRWLAYLDVFRGGELVDQWPTFQPGIRLV